METPTSTVPPRDARRCQVLARPRRADLRARLARAGAASLAAVALWACASAPAVDERPASTPAPRVAGEAVEPAATATAAAVAVARLPGLDRWRRHVRDELLPFWTHPDAFGARPGDFPTFRCNDGAAFRPGAPCPEFADAPDWFTRELGTEYTRMKSRQTFAYGVGFHITGDPALLAQARAGVEHLRRHAYEPAGGAVSYWRGGAPGPPPAQRTAQDLAYAQLGLAFHYYLTRDPEVLADLERLSEHLFTAYWAPEWGMLRWVLDDGPAGGPGQKELVAQLDPINAYLLLLAPLLDEPARGRWLRRLDDLSRALYERFYAPEAGLFWGAVHAPERTRLGTHHTDFGHTGKALWMLRLGARWPPPAAAERGAQAAPAARARFAAEAAGALLARAALPSGCWAAGVDAEGRVEPSSNWWTAAELDQLAATLALAEPARRARYAATLERSYACWLERFVDRDHGGVFPFLGPEPGARAAGPKAFHWKNGYHELEHALVALITTAGLTGEPLALHFAFRARPAPARVRPYYFQGRIARLEPLALPGLDGLEGVRVTFTDVR